MAAGFNGLEQQKAWNVRFTGAVEAATALMCWACKNGSTQGTATGLCTWVMKLGLQSFKPTVWICSWIIDDAPGGATAADLGWAEVGRWETFLWERVGTRSRFLV